MLLDITSALAEAATLLTLPPGEHLQAYAAAIRELGRDARNPNVLGDQRERAQRLGGELQARLTAETTAPPTR